MLTQEEMDERCEVAHRLRIVTRAKFAKARHGQGWNLTTEELFVMFGPPECDDNREEGRAGQPLKLSANLMAEIKERWEAGVNFKSLASEYGMSAATVSRIARRTDRFAKHALEASA